MYNMLKLQITVIIMCEKYKTGIVIICEINHEHVIKVLIFLPQKKGMKVVLKM